MFKRIGLLAIISIEVALSSSQTLAAMTVAQYDPARHDRFYADSDRAFLAENYDWSGIGRPSNVSQYWATMISPSFFLSSKHWHPQVGDTIRFYYTNNPNNGYEERMVYSGIHVGNSDVWIGMLTQGVTDRVAQYGMVDNSSWTSGRTDPLVGQKIWEFGQNTASTIPINQSIARNIITASYSTSISHDWNGASSYGTLGGDEALAISGDSGSPAFITVNNKPVLVGERYTGTSSGSVSYITSQIQSYVSEASGGKESIKTVAIPTHTTIPVIRETFEKDSVNTTPKGGDQTIQLRQNGSIVVVVGESGTHSDPFGSQGNQSLRIHASSSNTASSLFIEGIQTGVVQGQCLMDLFAGTPTHSSNSILFNLAIGHDYYGDMAINAKIEQHNESILDISLQRDGHLSINSNDGTYISDQSLEFNQKHQLQVLWRKQGTTDGYGDILIDGQPITTHAGQIRRFILKNLGNSTTDMDQIDSAYLTALWNDTDGDSEVYIDNIYLLDIPEPDSLILGLLTCTLLGRRHRKNNCFS